MIFKINKLLCQIQEKLKINKVKTFESTHVELDPVTSLFILLTFHQSRDTTKSNEFIEIHDYHCPM